MACLDIYQALTEKRPYKEGFSHEKTIAIMRELACKGKIDGAIVRDLDAFLSRLGFLPNEIKRQGAERYSNKVGRIDDGSDSKGTGTRLDCY